LISLTHNTQIHTSIVETFHPATDTIRDLWILSRMTTASDIDKAFTKALNEVGNFCNKDRLDRCIEMARALLADKSISRHQRMKALMLLASTLGDWEDANNCHVEAETLWRVHRRRHPEGENAELDAYMDELRGFLDEVGVELERTKHGDYESEEDVDDDAAAHEVSSSYTMCM